MEPHCSVVAFMASHCQLTAHVTLLGLPGLMTSGSKLYTVFVNTELLSRVVIIVLLGAMHPQGRFMLLLLLLSKLPHKGGKQCQRGLKEVIQKV